MLVLASGGSIEFVLIFVLFVAKFPASHGPKSKLLKSLGKVRTDEEKIKIR